MEGSSITFTVRGIARSELRATFWATRLTYSLITGSVIIFAEWSISVAYCLPRPISFSWEIMLRCATLRLPISSTSFFLSAPPQHGVSQKSNAASMRPRLRVVFIDVLLYLSMARLYIRRRPKAVAFLRPLPALAPANRKPVLTHYRSREAAFN